jgi:hypothetical protein
MDVNVPGDIHPQAFAPNCAAARRGDPRNANVPLRYVLGAGHRCGGDAKGKEEESSRELELDRKHHYCRWLKTGGEEKCRKCESVREMDDEVRCTDEEMVGGSSSLRYEKEGMGGSATSGVQ